MLLPAVLIALTPFVATLAAPASSGTPIACMGSPQGACANQRCSGSPELAGDIVPSANPASDGVQITDINSLWVFDRNSSVLVGWLYLAGGRRLVQSNDSGIASFTGSRAAQLAEIFGATPRDRVAAAYGGLLPLHGRLPAWIRPIKCFTQGADLAQS